MGKIKLIIFSLFAVGIIHSANGGEHTTDNAPIKKRGLLTTLGNLKQNFVSQLEKIKIVKDLSCLGWDFSSSELKPADLEDPENATSRALDRLLPELRNKMISGERFSALVLGDNVVLPAYKLTEEGKLSVISKTKYAEVIWFLIKNYEERANEYIVAKQKTQTFWGRLDLLGLNAVEAERTLVNLVTAIRLLKEYGAPLPILDEIAKRTPDIMKGRKPSNATAFNTIPLRLPSVSAPGVPMAGCTNNNEVILQVQSEMVLGRAGFARFQITKNGSKASTTLFNKNHQQTRLATKANSWKGKPGVKDITVAPLNILFTPSESDSDYLRVQMTLDDGNSVSFPATVRKSDLEEGKEISLDHSYSEGSDLVLTAEVHSGVKFRWDKAA